MKKRPIFILLRGILSIFFLFPILLFSQTSSFSVTVNATDDAGDNECTTAHCNYREALNAVNGFQGDVTIFFDIPGTGTTRRIELTADLPAMEIFVGSLTLDGTFQSGGAQVIIDGNNTATYGLNLFNADNTIVMGLSFDNFRTAGIYIDQATDNCSIGTPNGGNTFTRSRFGVLIDGTGANIQNNTFDNNDITGVYVDGRGASASIGEQNNPSADNIFIGQEVNGVEANTFSDYMNVFGNQFYCNEGRGIQNFNFSNNDISPPTISDASSTQIIGTGSPLNFIQLYAYDPNQSICSEANPCQGNIYLGSTNVSANGTWTISTSSLSAPILDSYSLTATQTSFEFLPTGATVQRYTSEFSSCFSLCDVYDIALSSIPPPCPGDQFRISADISTSGSGSEPLDITWTWPDGTTSTDPDISSTLLGTYTIKGTNSCNDITQSITITAEETPPASIQTGYNGPICEFDTLQLFAEEIKGIEYEWSGKFGFSSNAPNPVVNNGASSLRTGDYILNTKTSFNGCPGPSDTVSVLVKRPPQVKDTSLTACIDVNTTKSAIFDLTAANSLIVLDDDTTLSVQWYADQDLSFPIRTPQTFSSGIGEVFALVTDSLGCSSDTVTLSLQLAPLVNIGIGINAFPSCNVPNGGSLEALPSEGTAPFTFYWPELDTSIQKPDSLIAGSYTVIVTDSNFCMDTATINLPAPLGPEFSCAVLQDVDFVGASTGAALIRYGTSFQGPATIMYSGPSSGTIIGNTNAFLDTVPGLSAGDYQFIVQDALGCQDTCRLTITEPDCANFAIGANAFDVSCGGAADGVIRLSFGGVAPFDFDWSDDQYDGQSLIIGISGGIYEVTVTDSEGCKDSLSITINEEEPTLVFCEVVQNVSRVGAADGEASIRIAGGISPYILSWTGQQRGSITSTTTGTFPIANMEAGDYEFVVVDSAGCSDTCRLSITDVDCSDLSFNSIVSNPSCNGFNNGSISIDINGGSTPYIINWNIDSLSNQTTANNLPAGSYVIEVLDALGCSFLDTVLLSEAEALVLNCNVSQDVITVNGSEGIVELQYSGGVAGYGLQLIGPVNLDRNLSSAGSLELSGLEAGLYTLILTDANDCAISCSFEISAPSCSALQIRAQKNDISCFSAQDGAISLEVVGAIAPIDFDWNDDNFDGLFQANNLQAGVYNIVVTDSIGCKDSISIEIIEPNLIRINCSIINEVSNIGAADGIIGFEMSGGTGPYILRWTGSSNGERSFDNPQDIQIDNLPAGDYLLSLTDANGCEQSCNISLEAVDCSTLELNLQKTDISCFGAQDGQIQANVLGGNPPYNFSWNIDFSGDQLTNLGPGNYVLLVTDALGCTVRESIEIIEPPLLQLFCSDIIGVSQQGSSDGQISFQVLGGAADFSLTIQGPVDTSATYTANGTYTFSNLSPGTYSAILSDANNCQDTCDFIIPDFNCADALIANLNLRPESCPGTADGAIFVEVTQGSAPLNYDWNIDDLDGQSFIQNLAAGIYSLTLSDANNCSIILDTTLSTLNEAPSIEISGNASICQDACHSLELNLNGEGPFNLEYTVLTGDIAQQQNLLIEENSTSIEICTADFPVDATSIEIQFTSLSDANCSIELQENRVINILPTVRSTLDPVLCFGESIVINDTQYDSDNPIGEEILIGAASNGCDSIVEISLFFITNPEIINLDTLCNLENNTFQIRFDILGAAPYSVDGLAGNILGNTFISNELAANGTYELTVTDAFACSSSLSINAPNCLKADNCFVKAGTLVNFESNLCQFEPLNLQTQGDEVLDTNSIQLFVLHDGGPSELGNILLSNQNGIFNYVPTLNLNQNYFTATIAGRDNGFGRLDFSDPCLDISLGPVVQFNDAPRRPNFIQGQDTLCVGETLILYTELYPEDGIQYHWISPLGDTMSTDNNSIQYPDIVAGAYSVFVSQGVCTSPIFSPHRLTTIDFPIVYAGEDQVLCNIDQTILQADPISFGIGEWESQSSAIIISPNSDSTTVRNLEEGENVFIWTVNANDCVNQDTVRIYYFPTPEVNDDVFELEPGLTRITFDPFSNDFVLGIPLNDTTLQILNQPEVGSIQFLEDEQVFEYTAVLSDIEAVAFEYMVCPPECLSNCDSALVTIDLPDVILDVPNGIVVGRNNEGLQIGNLEVFPDNEMIIANRWGVVVFRQDNYSNDNPWKGTHNGTPLPQATYYMYLRIEGKKDIIRKTIHLIVQ